MPKSNKTYSIDTVLTDALDARAKETGEKMSRLVEQGIRLVLSMPAPEVEEDERGFEPTRTERDCLEVLRNMQPGWQSTTEIMKIHGGSYGSVLKAMHALARRGECYRWGDAVENSNGTFVAGWGMRPPLEVIAGILKGKTRSQVGDALPLLAKLCESIDDAPSVRALVRTALGLPTPVPEYGMYTIGLESMREIVAQKNKEEARKARDFAAGRA